MHQVSNLKGNRDPLCERCLKKGIVKERDLSHHIKRVATHPELRLVLDNLESLCVACHDWEHKGERWGR